MQIWFWNLRMGKVKLTIFTWKFETKLSEEKKQFTTRTFSNNLYISFLKKLSMLYFNRCKDTCLSLNFNLNQIW